VTYDAAEEGSEERLGREVIADFFQAEEHSTNGSTESNGDTTSSTSAEDLPALSIVVTVLGEDTARDVSYASRDVHIRTFLTKTET
jgi:hypothetical protein